MRCSGPTAPVTLVAYAGDENDVVTGSSEPDYLFGGPGDYRLDGGPGGDELYGNEGSNALISTTGDDRLYGGTGPGVIKLKSNRPLGDADRLVANTAATNGPYICGADDTVFGARAGDELRQCSSVEGLTPARPHFTATEARTPFTCPSSTASPAATAPAPSPSAGDAAVAPASTSPPERPRRSQSHCATAARRAATPSCSPPWGATPTS